MQQHHQVEVLDAYERDPARDMGNSEYLLLVLRVERRVNQEAHETVVGVGLLVSVPDVGACAVEE